MESIEGNRIEKNNSKLVKLLMNIGNSQVINSYIYTNILGGLYEIALDYHILELGDDCSRGAVLFAGTKYH